MLPYTVSQRDLNRSAETCSLTLCAKNTGRRRLRRSQESGALTFRGVKKGFSEEAVLELRSVGRRNEERFRQRGEHVQRLRGGREHGECEELRRLVWLEWGIGGGGVWGGGQGQAVYEGVMSLF